MEYIKENIIKEIKLTKENMCILLDFDRTITNFDSLDSWAVAGMASEEGCMQEMDILYEKYRPIETNYNITFEEKNKKMEEWYNSCMELYFKYKFNKNKLEKAIKENKLVFRKGAKEFLEYTNKNKIPVVILSAGIGSVIEEFLKYENVYFNNILLISNTFVYDKNGNAIRLENSLIHTMNKTTKNHLKGIWKEEFLKRKYRLLVGDTIEDINMVDEKEINKTIKIAFMEEKLELEKYREKFDIVYTREDANFNKIIKLIK